MEGAVLLVAAALVHRRCQGMIRRDVAGMVLMVLFHL